MNLLQIPFRLLLVLVFLLQKFSVTWAGFTTIFLLKRHSELFLHNPVSLGKRSMMSMLTNFTIFKVICK